MGNIIFAVRSFRQKIVLDFWEISKTENVLAKRKALGVLADHTSSESRNLKSVVAGRGAWANVVAVASMATAATGRTHGAHCWIVGGHVDYVDIL